MDVRAFAQSLLHALSNVKAVQRVAMESEVPIVDGRAYLHNRMFLAFYYNETTGTMAFALVREGERIWGLDFDNIRGWHLHPVANPRQHVEILPQSVPEIIRQLEGVLNELNEQD